MRKSSNWLWMSLLAMFAVLLFAAAPANAQRQSADGAWTLLPQHSAQVEASEPWVRPVKAQALVLKPRIIRTLLAAAPQETFPPNPANRFLLALPNPDGEFRVFSIAESPVMEPALAAQFPEIKTYVGQGVDDPAATVRMDMTPQGFHAQVRSPGGHWYIDPYVRLNDTFYSSYYKKDLREANPWVCEFNEQVEVLPGKWRDNLQTIGTDSTGPSLRVLRLAVAATGEYTAFHGGTVTLGQAAIVTAINRCTGVYETEIAVRLVLVANNSSLVYTNASTDPYTNTNGSTMLGQNQTNIDAVIGTANYDLGHVFSTGGGGIAGLGVVCTSGSKARGVTGSSSPTGDAFWIDYVVHEMGHELGGDHAFNGTGGSCAGGNRNAATAYEPGSGSTIMNYAGICGADDLQPHSDAYFGFIGIQEIRAVIDARTTCGTTIATGNSAPTVTAPGMSGVTIPIGTPFALTAVGTDPNGDALTYCWEERDLGAAQTLAAADNGASPIFRSFSPTTNPTRTFPALSKILAGTSNTSEKLPALSRAASNYRVTVRDNRAGGGGVNSADVAIAITSAAGPFAVTSPASAVTWAGGSTQSVTWNVAGTTANGVNTANVSILLSTDGGNTFPITVLASTPNTGSANIVVPNNVTTTGRIKVQPIGNVYFAIGAGTVTITSGVPTVSLSGTGSNTVNDTTGNGNSNGRIDPGESAVGVNVQVINNGTLGATGVSGTLSSLTGTVTVTTPVSTYANLAPGASAINATPYVVNVSSAHPCGTPVALRLTINSAQGSGVYDFSLPTGTTGGAVTQTFAYSGPVVAIPDNVSTGASAQLVVSGVTGTITNVKFRFDGSACSATAGATTVGLDHTWLGDLVVTLTSPAATAVVLANRPGGTNMDGNNFCGTVFDDAAASPIQSIVTAGAPYTGSFTPNAPLAAFNGQSPNGTWTLNVADLAAVDTGNIRAFSLIITTVGTVCTPPNNSVCPSFTAQPTGGSPCPGSPFTFTANATGTPTITYQWRFNTNPISGATSSSYTIASVSPGNSGSYDCIATNGCGSTPSNAVTLFVQAPCSVADITGIGGTGCPDGLLTGDDFNLFISAFANSAPQADIVSVGGLPPPDGLITGDDFNAFIAAFAQGCP